mmetsp:Transcript_17918/g.45931  ORF Transcript_17918/g.45931 Transcript_17918/m.45931 type:complete len:278 (+) Transcript_17918:65-898(+)
MAKDARMQAPSVSGTRGSSWYCPVPSLARRFSCSWSWRSRSERAASSLRLPMPRPPRLKGGCGCAEAGAGAAPASSSTAERVIEPSAVCTCVSVCRPGCIPPSTRCSSEWRRPSSPSSRSQTLRQAGPWQCGSSCAEARLRQTLTGRPPASAPAAPPLPLLGASSSASSRRSCSCVLDSLAPFLRFSDEPISGMRRLCSSFHERLAVSVSAASSASGASAPASPSPGDAQLEAFCSSGAVMASQRGTYEVQRSSSSSSSASASRSSAETAVSGHGTP